MSDDDLIRRGDALVEVEFYRMDYMDARNAIAALPAHLDADLAERAGKVVKRLGVFRTVWGELPSIAPHRETAPGITTGTVIHTCGDAADLITTLLAQNAALRAERERLALAICGGEDAPGYANAQTVDALEKVARQNAESHMIDIGRLQSTEAENARLREALIWCSGSDDFQDGGFAREGWLKLCVPLLKGDDHE